MVGYTEESLVYPILDLIHNELNKAQADSGLFDGIPAVVLYRENPQDEWVVTSVDMLYPSNCKITVDLLRGSEDESTYPKDIKQAEKEFYRLWRVVEVLVSYIDTDKNLIASYKIGLHYNEKGMMDSTSVQKVG